MGWLTIKLFDMGKGRWVPKALDKLRDGISARAIREKARAQSAARVYDAIGDRAVEAIKDGKLDDAVDFLINPPDKKEKLARILSPVVPKVQSLTNAHPVGRQFGVAWANHAANSDEWAEQHWRKVLTEQVECPGKYSLFALDALSKMSKEDIEHFTLLASCRWNIGIVALRPWSADPRFPRVAA